MQIVSSILNSGAHASRKWFLLSALFMVGMLSVGADAQRGRDARVSRASLNAPVASTSIVINEVYGGAGCGTAGCSTYQNDFIELKNIGATPVSISGWSVQYASATGTAWQVTPLGNAIIQAGDTYLVGESFSANGVSPIPAPNTSGTIAMSSTAAKVALVNTTTALTGSCPTGAGIIDLVGYGATASCFEGAAAAPAPSTTTSVSRNAAGADTDQNAADFTAVAPTPRAATAPTAAGVTVSGRVVSADGRGIRNAFVSIAGGDLADVINVRTGSRGEYSFDDIPAGRTYTVTVAARRFSFDQPTQVISLQDNLGDLNFIGSVGRVR